MTGTNVTNYDEAYAKAAEGYANQDRSAGGSLMSTKSGVLRLDENELLGNQFACVIVDSVLENTYFEHGYDPDLVLPPTCYAFSREADGMKAHLESMKADQSFFKPQNFQRDTFTSPCDGCQKNTWGSGDKGRGKACKNTYRLALLPAGYYEAQGRDYDLNLYTDEKHYASAGLVYLKIPVTSTKLFENYRSQLRTQHRRPPFGVFTRIFLTPHKDHQFHVNFEFIDLADSALGPTLFNRNGDLVKDAFKGYEPPSAEDKQKAGGGSSARGNFGRR